jgi:hypothetical protein
VKAPLPLAWQQALERDAACGASEYADLVRERRLARMLAGFIAAGLLFLVLPGTLLGVWNLVGISSRRAAESVQANFIQAHGHAQLLGWIGTFIIGISLYTLPKFRGAKTRSIEVAWLMLGLWTGAIALRWMASFETAPSPWIWRFSAVAEVAVACLLVWQTSARVRLRGGKLWDHLIFAGFGGLVGTLALQLVTVWNMDSAVVPAAINSLTIHLALWSFCLPVVWGYSLKIIPPLIGLPPASGQGTRTALAIQAAAVIVYAGGFFRQGAALGLCAVVLACWSMRIFRAPVRTPKVTGVDRRYPMFVRISFVWLIVSALLGLWADLPGMTGASRHAFTVGFLATLVFAIGPRILPSFLNSRELWSPRLMLISNVLLTAGCVLRVGSEPFAYGDVVPLAWRVLPISAVTELTAVILFTINMGVSMASKIPAWIGDAQVKDTLPVYWYVMSYPATRNLLIENGLTTLAVVPRVPKALTLREAAAADGIDVERLLASLREFFASRRARALSGHRD